MTSSTTSRAPHTYKLVPFDAYEQTTSYTLFFLRLQTNIDPTIAISIFRRRRELIEICARRMKIEWKNG